MSSTEREERPTVYEFFTKVVKFCLSSFLLTPIVYSLRRLILTLERCEEDDKMRILVGIARSILKAIDTNALCESEVPGEFSDDASDDSESESDSEASHIEEIGNEPLQHRWLRRNPALRGLVLEVEIDGAFIPVEPNALEAQTFENDLVQGRMLFMVATEPSCCKHLDEHAPRKFEMQMQTQLKEKPTSVLRMGAELEQKPKLSAVTTALVRTAMNFVQHRTPGLQWSLGDKHKKPHCAFPLATGVDALVMTAPSSETNPPMLGGQLPETDAERIKRRATKPELLAQFLPGPTYSFAFYSSFLDLCSWRVSGMPIGSPSLNSLFGPGQPVDIIVYDCQKQNDHQEEQKRYWLRFRLRWDDELDKKAQEIFADRQKVLAQKALRRKQRKQRKRQLSMQANLQSVAIPSDLKDALRYGATVGIRVDIARLDRAISVTTAEQDEHFSVLTRGRGVLCLTETRSGYAVCRELAVPLGLVIEKANDVAILQVSNDDKSEKKQAQCTERYVRDGDVIRITTRGSRNPMCLTTSRGRWLSWRTLTVEDKQASQRDLFVLETIASLSGTCSFLKNNGSNFRLRSFKQPDCHVTVAAPQAKYGGRLLRLRKCQDVGSNLALSPRNHETRIETSKIPLALELTTCVPTIDGMPIENIRISSFDETAEDVWTISDIRVAGWVELVDRRVMRAVCAYLILIKLDNVDKPSVVKRRLRTSEELAAAIGIHQAELAVGRGGKIAAPGALRRVRRAEKKQEDRRQRALNAARAVADKAKVHVGTNASKAADAARFLSIKAITKVVDVSTAVNKNTAVRTTTTPTTAELTEVAATGQFFQDEESVTKSSEENSLSSSANTTGDIQTGAPPKQREAPKTPLGAGARQSALFLKSKMLPVAASLKSRFNAAAKEAKDVVERRRIKSVAAVTNQTNESSFEEEIERPASSPDFEDIDVAETVEEDVKKDDSIFEKNDFEITSVEEEVTMPTPAGIEPVNNTPWITSFIASERPPYHRAPADVCVHMLNLELRRRLDVSSDLERRDLESLLIPEGTLDLGFVHGSAVEIGTNLSSSSRPPVPDGVAVVARAIGEAHWAEQLAVLRGNRLDIIESLSTTVSLSLPLHEIVGARSIDGATDEIKSNQDTSSLALEDSSLSNDDTSSPLRCGKFIRRAAPRSENRMEQAPFALLVVETVGLCHYLGFASAERRDSWAAALALARAYAAIDESAINTTSRDPRDNFVLRPVAYHGDRLVLNGRRLQLDADRPDPRTPPWELALQLLRRVFTLTPDADDFDMASIFDQAAALRHLPLSALENQTPKEAMVFFLNIHHALLQHALLLLGAPKKPAEIHAFASTISYDMLGDIFSLHEIATCVLRGSFYHQEYNAIHHAENQQTDDFGNTSENAPKVKSEVAAEQVRTKLGLLASTGRRNIKDGKERLTNLYRAAKAKQAGRPLSPPSSKAEEFVETDYQAESPAETMSQISESVDDTHDREPLMISKPPPPPFSEQTKNQGESPTRRLGIAACGSRTTTNVSTTASNTAHSDPTVPVARPPARAPVHRGRSPPPAATHAAVWGWPHPAAPRNNDPHWELALRDIDPRLAFAVNSASTDFPRNVFEFTPTDISDQLDAAATAFFANPGTILVDAQRRIVSLPAVCDFFRSTSQIKTGIPDTNRDILKACLHFVDKSTGHMLSELLQVEAPPIQVNFRPPSKKYHDSLVLETLLDRAKLRAVIRASLRASSDSNSPKERINDEEQRPSSSLREDFYSATSSTVEEDVPPESEVHEHIEDPEHEDEDAAANDVEEDALNDDEPSHPDPDDDKIENEEESF